MPNPGLLLAALALLGAAAGEGVPVRRHVGGPAMAAAADSLVDFQFEDQFGHAYARAAYAERAVVAMVGDRGGSVFCTALRRAFATAPFVQTPAGAAVLVIADLRGVPSLLHGVVRRSMPKDRGEPVLLDWKGVFGSMYALPKDACLVLTAAPGGRIVGRAVVRDSSSTAVHAVVAHVGADLAAARP